MNPYRIENSLNSVVDKINTIQSELKKFGFDEVADMLPKVELIVKYYDREAYVETTQAFNFVIGQIDKLIDFVGIPVHKQFFMVKNLTLNSFEGEVDTLTKNMHKNLDEVRKSLELYGVFVAFDPFEDVEIPNDDQPEESTGREDIKPTVNRGYTRLQGLPNQSLSTTQGAGFDEEYWYVFGTFSGGTRPMTLSVVHKTDPKKSFVAKGDLGTYLSGDALSDVSNQHNILGHANDCSVISKEYNIVTLLVASTIPGQVATCIVDLSEKTAKLGEVIPLIGDKGRKIGMATSSQALGDGRVILKASGFYQIGMYDEKGITLAPFAKHNNANATSIIEDKFGKEFLGGPVIAQADWYENGYIYMTVWEHHSKKSLILELEANGPDRNATPTGRFWWDVDSQGRSFEIEKVWFEKNQMRINVAMTSPTEHFILEPHWRY